VRVERGKKVCCVVRREGVVTCGFLVRVSVVSGDDDVCSRRLIHIPWLSYEKRRCVGAMKNSVVEGKVEELQRGCVYQGKRKKRKKIPPC